MFFSNEPKGYYEGGVHLNRILSVKMDPCLILTLRFINNEQPLLGSQTVTLFHHGRNLQKKQSISKICFLLCLFVRFPVRNMCFNIKNHLKKSRSLRKSLFFMFFSLNHFFCLPQVRTWNKSPFRFLVWVLNCRSKTDKC